MSQPLEMKKEEYLLTQMKLITLAKEIHKLNIEGFLRTITTAEAVGPVLDPTMYQKAQRNLETIKKLAESFVTVKESFDKVLTTVIQHEVIKGIAESAEKPK